MFAKFWKWDLEQIFSSLECFSFPRRRLLKVVWGAEFHFDLCMELHLNRNGELRHWNYIYFGISGKLFQVKSYNKLRKTMLPAFPVYHTLESHRIEANQAYTALQTKKTQMRMGKGAYQRLLLVFWIHISKKMTGNLLNLIFFSFVSQKVNCLKW